MADYNDNEVDGEHEDESVGLCGEETYSDPRIATLFDKYQKETDLDVIKQTKDLHIRISHIFTSSMKIRPKLREFIEVLDEWPLFWVDFPEPYGLDPRCAVVRSFSAAPSETLKQPADLANRAGLRAAFEFIINAQEYHRGRFSHAPPEFFADLIELAVKHAVDVALGTRNALAAEAEPLDSKKTASTDPVSALGHPTYSSKLPDQVSAPGRCVARGGAVTSSSSSNLTLESELHHCRGVGGEPSSCAVSTSSSTDPVSALSHPTYSSKLPDQVSPPGRCVARGGAVTSSSSSNLTLESELHHCREVGGEPSSNASSPVEQVSAAAASPPAVVDGHRAKPFEKLSNRDVKALRRTQREKYKEQLKEYEALIAAAQHESKTTSGVGDKGGAAPGSEAASLSQLETVHQLRAGVPATPTTAGVQVIGPSIGEGAGSVGGVSARSGKRATGNGSPGERGARLARG